MDSLRGWGHAKELRKMQWMMLQRNSQKISLLPPAFSTPMRQFVEMAAARLGIKLRFEGTGVEEKGIVVSVTGRHRALTRRALNRVM